MHSRKIGLFRLGSRGVATALVQRRSWVEERAGRNIDPGVAIVFVEKRGLVKSGRDGVWICASRAGSLTLKASKHCLVLVLDEELRRRVAGRPRAGRICDQRI